MENFETLPKLSAEIAVTADAARLVARATTEPEMARELFPRPIETQDDADEAGQYLNRIRANGDALNEKKEEVCAPARRIIRTMLNWFGPALLKNSEADDYIAGLLSDWTLRERKRQDDAKREADRIARELRQRQEKEAAQARAVAEEKARQLAQDAARAAQALQATPTPEAAAAAASARSEAETADFDAQLAAQAELDLASQPLGALQTLPKRGKISGIRMSDHWSAELKGPETTVKELIVLDAVQCQTSKADGSMVPVIVRPELLGYLKLDRVALNRSAVALKEALNVPGVSAVNNPRPARE